MSTSSLTPAMILCHISAGYEGKEVLSQVDLTVYERDYLGIIGPNGGGKSTLIKVMLGLLTPQQGHIHYYKDGVDTEDMSMGYLPQYNHIDKQFPISVYDTILSGLNKKKRLWQSFRREHHEQVEATIARMGLEGMEKYSIGQLSGGQLQRVLLGRALVANPRVIILDEPNTYIDKRFEAKLYSLLEEINKTCAIVLVSHDINSVFHHAKHIACVDGTLTYHEDGQVPALWLSEHLGIEPSFYVNK
ncbi:MAG: ABC transporter ATP-binding protein [Phocaeicola sp.]|nr:ABC transporter ATP-binding protein [Phocaeicola sp.]MDD7449117.1 ABC transporter ATP-binding protein [Prevotellaceae bacterium]MDY3915066.1 ABC transporter ATP-binding protein [Phocaeicola sp.]